MQSVLGRSFKNKVLFGNFDDFLMVKLIPLKAFKDWLRPLKYENLKVCKEIWSHKVLNDEWENDFKVALTQLTKHFLETGGAEKWMKIYCRTKGYVMCYKAILRRVLAGIENPQFFKLKMNFD